MGSFPEKYFKANLYKAQKYEEFKKLDGGSYGKMITSEWVKWLNSFKNILTKQNLESEVRTEMMNLTVPAFNLRNYLLEVAIKDAESGSYEKINHLLELCKKPFDKGLLEEYPESYQMPPDWAKNLCLSCSS